MSRSLARTASAALIVVVLVSLLLLFYTLHLPENLIGHPPLQLPAEPQTAQSGRPLQALYQLEAVAAREGWTSDRYRQAGDLWNRLGDPRRAVAYWESADPDAILLRERAQAYIDLGRWADAADTLSNLLTLLPPAATDRAWAQFQLGLISAAYNPAQALDLLRAAEPTYGDSAAALLPILEGAPDPLRIGIALSRQNLWAYAELAFSQSADPLASAYGGLARDMQGKDGSTWIETALTLAPDDPQVRFLQALHLRLNYDYAGSLDAMIQAVALDPENPALYAELGRAYQLTGDLATAEHWLKFAVSLDANFQPMLDSFYDDEKSALISLGLVDEAALPFDAARTPEP